MFGNLNHICPDHSVNDHEIKTCFLDRLTAAIEEYAHSDDEKLTTKAQELKRAILEAVIIERPREVLPLCYNCNTNPPMEGDGPARYDGLCKWCADARDKADA